METKVSGLPAPLHSPPSKSAGVSECEASLIKKTNKKEHIPDKAWQGDLICIARQTLCLKGIYTTLCTQQHPLPLDAHIDWEDKLPRKLF